MSAKYSRERMMRKRNRKRLRTELRIIYDELRNLAEGELDRQFDEALERGELLEYQGTQDELQDFLVSAMDEYFGLQGGEHAALLQDA